jgi:hypothetical protein
LFGDSFFEASCRSAGKPTGDFLRIVKNIERYILTHRRVSTSRPRSKYEASAFSTVAVPSHRTNTVVRVCRWGIPPCGDRSGYLSADDLTHEDNHWH